MDVENIIILFVIGLLAFAGFAIYFFFKILEFVIQATNLYRKMINRQDAMIKLLIDIRGPGDYQDDVEVTESPQIDEIAIQSAQVAQRPHQGDHHWGKNAKGNAHEVVKTCPKCNDIFHGTEFENCGKCNCALVST